MPYSPNVDYRKQARLAAQRYGLDPHIFERQIGVESIGYRPDVISGRTASPAGAQGIAQFMPDTARGLGVDPLRPVKALNAAAKLMASYVKKYGSYENALRAYNAGPGAIQSSRGYAETNRYVQEILNGRDPEHLARPQTGHGGRHGGAAPTVVPGTPPTAATLGGLNVPPPDLSGLQALLSQQDAPAVPAPTPIATPEFSASRYLQAPQIESVQQPSQPDGGLAAKLAAIGAGGPSLTPLAPTAGTAGTPTRVVGGGRQDGPVGRTLVIGDSLEVGTFPLLKQKLGNKVHGIMVGGKPSAWGIAQLKRQFKTGNYDNVVFDLGTNDASASDLRRSLKQLTQIAGDAKVYVSTVNSPFDEKAKNSLLRTYARNHPNVTLIPWHGASNGGASLPDGIHGGYGQRAGLLANALGYQPSPGKTKGGPALNAHGHWGGAEGPVVSLFQSFGKPLGLSVTSNKRNNTNPYSGKGSDHDYGNKNAYAIDASNGSAPTPEMDEYAYRVMHALGFNNYRKGTPINTSQGVKTINGVQYQVIYRGAGRAFGGDHTNHVHIGAHRV